MVLPGHVAACQLYKPVPHFMLCAGTCNVYYACSKRSSSALDCKHCHSLGRFKLILLITGVGQTWRWCLPSLTTGRCKRS